jgi:signal transduction histidine kinase
VSSIRGALARRLLLALFLMLAAIGGGLSLLVRAQLTADFDAALGEKARVLAGLMKKEGDTFELELAESPMPEFARPEEPEYFQVWLGDVVFLRSASLAGDLPPPAGAVFADLALPDGRAGRAAWLRFPVRIEGPLHGAPPPAAALVIARGRAPLDRALGRVSLALALAGALLLMGLPLVVVSGVRRGLRPLDQVATQAAQIEAHSLESRFRVGGLPAELHPIAARLNDLLERLSAAFERERRFSADVAHELRTPIAELRTLAEVALQAPETHDRRAFEDVLAAALQMERLVTMLLTLARCESQRQPVVLETVSLARALDEAWSPLAARARARRLRVTGAACEVEVSADRLMLSSILGNLLANAVEYAPAGGAVGWQLTAGPAVELVIRNSNETLAAADVTHVFEPFWRKDAARADGAHGGLGLSLVAAFARLIGAEVRLELVASEVLAHLTLRPPGPGPGPAA